MISLKIAGPAVAAPKPPCTRPGSSACPSSPKVVMTSPVLEFISLEERGPRRGRAKPPLHPARQQRVPVLSKGSDDVAGAGIERIKVFASTEHDALLCIHAARPIN